jgi:hypothetical protein
MTRSQIKALFRRRVHDVEGVQWSDTEQNDIVNLAYSKVQKEIVKFRRDAHLYWDTIDAVAGTSLYPLPATFGVRRVELKPTAADGYAKLHKKEWEDIMDLVDGVTNYYCLPNENWLGIYPAPSTSVVSGIRLIHTPIMSLSTDDEVPRIKLPLHDAIALWAVLVAKGETDEDGQLAKEELANILGDAREWYEAPSDEAEKFQVVGV